ncbi:GNAT family N-acetyltransferase [Streptomyces macrosporus]|uniref:GNAT family N-acetyltransferase n=1 Tax=Streptomyces macrosporus TaxID=44032 RepID=A0ABP5XAP7_9ACTN
MRVRGAAETDLEAIAALRVRGWRYAYRDLMPRRHLEAMDAAADAARRRSTFAATRGTTTDLVAVEDDGRIVGRAAFGPCRDGDASPADGEVYALYAEPERVGTGVGRTLLGEVIERSAGQGRPRLLLWVVEGNARARRFYAAAGFVADGTVGSFEVAGVSVPEVRYVREPRGAHL